jgi:hypothetical protein
MEDRKGEENLMTEGKGKNPGKSFYSPAPFFKNTNQSMNIRTKERLIKMLIYLILGFGIAFFWHKMKT